MALITGGDSGIGRAVAILFAKEGANVAVVYFNEHRDARETKRLVEAEGRKCLLLAGDVGREKFCKDAVQRTRRELGKINILVNNAGWDKVEPFVDSQPATWDKVIAINLKGPINFCHAVIPQMIERGAGKIITISSDAGRVGSTGEAVYSACKAGVIGFSKTLARELARSKINVNVVCPGPTDTALLKQVTAGERGARIIEAMTKAVPFRRLGQPEEIANAVAFFASPDADFVTGQVLSVSGGLTMVG